MSKTVYVARVDGIEIGRRTSERAYTHARIGRSIRDGRLLVTSWHGSLALARKGARGWYRIVDAVALREVKPRGPVDPAKLALRRAVKEGTKAAEYALWLAKQPRPLHAEEWSMRNLRERSRDAARYAFTARPDLRMFDGGAV